MSLVKSRNKDKKQKEVVNEKCVWTRSVKNHYNIFKTSCGAITAISTGQLKYVPSICDVCGRLIEYRN